MRRLAVRFGMKHHAPLRLYTVLQIFYQRGDIATLTSTHQISDNNFIRGRIHGIMYQTRIL